jgi:hypothetical protein
VEPLTHRLLRRTAGGPAARRSELDINTTLFAGRWIALLDERVVADDESPAGLMRKIWESHFPVDDVRFQFVDAPLPGPATKAG